ncbi:MAG: tetratricopeptide repeat protein [Candidatus Azobacteroides sp.]|nr:tetratricopeptide repeat protein [Candidatus Azobacteroides sp.]
MKTRCFFLLLGVILLNSCSSTKNTSGTRWYHSFNTKYNVYFNGSEAYKQALKAQLEGYTENYSEMILMYPVSALPKDKTNSGGAFDKAIEKAVKAIKMHSIQTKPERKQGKQNDPKYQAFINRKEYNPFLHNAWMLMAKSQFYNGDFLEAASSFSYISRLYELQPEIAISAKLWKARCYAEMGWFYEADDILSKINRSQLSKKQNNWFSTVYADYLIKQKQYAEAVPYLKTAIRSEKNRLQRTREKYLLGQLYASTGQKEAAYKAFGEVSSANAPYIIELSAKIRQTEVYPGGDIKKMSKKLIQMTKSSKNEEYLDQIYYALGNVYMTVPDTVKAIESYESGVEKSTRGGIDKMLNQIKLGDIYFNQRKYLKAQPNYSEALGLLKKGDEAYSRISKRSEALDALVIHVEAVELQDSLQRLARMTEEDRMAVINKIIDDIIKKEKEAAEKNKQDEYQAKQDELQGQLQANRPGPPAVMGGITSPGESDVFYFYNPQMVAIGKNAFQQKWGRRTLEDDWRRRNKSGTLADLVEDSATADTTLETDSITTEGGGNSGAALPQSTEANAVSNDPKDPQFYLQQIPVTEEDFAASDLIISTGLFNMGVIYKDLLEDNLLALETFETLNTRFPDNENKQMAYYYMYLIYWQQGDMESANLYKSKIRAEFAESDLAIAMADPNYEYNQKRMYIVQDSLYQQTYADYLAGSIKNIRNNYEVVSTKYNQSKLMPKFMFLNALSFAITNEPDTFKVLLNELVDKYPNEDVAALSSEIMKGFQRGLLLSASGDNMLVRGSLFNIRFGEEGEAISDSTIQFSDETKTAHELLLIYPKESLNDNLLLYVVAGYNFGNFMVNDFALEKTTIGGIGLLRIKGFNSQEEVLQYLQKIREPGGYAQEWGQMVVPVPISSDNYTILMKGKSLEEYMTFFEEHFAKGNENLIAQWRLKQIEEMEVFSENEEEHLLPGTDEKPVEETQLSETVLPADTGQITLPADSIHINLPDSLSTEAAITSDKAHDTANDVYNKASEETDKISDTYNTIASDPIRGFLNLFKRNKSNNAIEEFAKQQEKEEKERQMQLKKEQDEKDKAAKVVAVQQEKERNESLKKQAEEEKSSLRTKQQEQKDATKQKETEKKQKEAEKKRLAKEKKESQEKALKKKKEDQKAKEKARQEDQKRKEKERAESRKQKEKERKERVEQQKQKGRKK